MANLNVLNDTKRVYCWCCGRKSFEWLGFRVFWERRGKCFYCRIDALDEKYGPGWLATQWMLSSKNGKYRRPYPTYRELRRLIKTFERRSYDA